ncbi:hypothetical protein [Cupriavidus pauculus]|uniref:hypothetical protein n=1 Tax=Cupriavidus pauculus TaxID=82633 RepID=UPI001FD30D83|nr:hypothetical protein [Cupriavidus pauculus]
MAKSTDLCTLTMTPTEAATLIQKNWRAFVKDRRYVANDSREIAGRIGHLVATEGDFWEYVRRGRVIVQINGAPDGLRRGHSCFFFEGKIWHYLVGEPVTFPDGTVLSRYPTRVEPFFGDYGGIRRDWIQRDHAYNAKINYLICNRRISVLHDAYTRHFTAAFNAESQRFALMPFSYGLHYNCNVLVRNVLRRIERMALGGASAPAASVSS